ncbi:MAG: hypothetical protein WKF84_27095 [Pyrinomonadaceae bacterium]
MLVEWLQKLLPAVKHVADSSDAPLHVYLYERHGQRSLLDALARHFDALCGIPAFYDLLTSTPALTQSMISFLGDEVSERQNLGAICHNLYEVAAALGFKWREGEVNVPAKFRSRIFDNRRRYQRNTESSKFSLEGGATSSSSSAGVWVESAARFGTQIPLEYAYAAWGELKNSAAMTSEARAQIDGFLGTTVDDIKALAHARLAALRHIEAAFRYKNRQVEKQSLMLGRLDEVEVDPSTVPLRRSLEDFLRLEHLRPFARAVATLRAAAGASRPNRTHRYFALRILRQRREARDVYIHRHRRQQRARRNANRNDATARRRLDDAQPGRGRREWRASYRQARRVWTVMCGR